MILFVASSNVNINNLPQVGANTSTISTVLTIVFSVVGGLAVLMIVVSGLRYIFSAGDAQKASEAKQGILYSLIGLAVAALAEALVAFVLNKL